MSQGQRLSFRAPSRVADVPEILVLLALRAVKQLVFAC